MTGLFSSRRLYEIVEQAEKYSATSFHFFPSIMMNEFDLRIERHSRVSKQKLQELLSVYEAQGEKQYVLMLRCLEKGNDTENLLVQIGGEVVYVLVALKSRHEHELILAQGKQIRPKNSFWLTFLTSVLFGAGLGLLSLALFPLSHHLRTVDYANSGTTETCSPSSSTSFLSTCAVCTSATTAAVVASFSPSVIGIKKTVILAVAGAGNMLSAGFLFTRFLYVAKEETLVYMFSELRNLRVLEFKEGRVRLLLLEESDRWAPFPDRDMRG